MTTIYNKLHLKRRRSELRRSSPQAEGILWARIRKRQLDNHKFRRQHSINNYVVDFYCPKQKLAIEIDGPTHFQGLETERRDQERQRRIESLGITMLRFTNKDVYTNIENVVLSISEVLNHHH